MTKDTLYLKIDQNVQVKDSKVMLGDIATLECSNKEIEQRIKVIRLPGATTDKPGRYIHSVMEIITQIHAKYPGLEINNLGEADFIITYEKKQQPGKTVSWMKTIFVCFLSFFGAAFAIMTFNNDVDIPRLFGQLYVQFTGQPSNGFTILELSYSIGVGAGILLFFNHFVGRKFTADPTPMEVEMRKYEDDVNTTLIESSIRNPQQQNNSQ